MAVWFLVGGLVVRGQGGGQQDSWAGQEVGQLRPQALGPRVLIARKVSAGVNPALSFPHHAPHCRTSCARRLCVLAPMRVLLTTAFIFEAPAVCQALADCGHTALPAGCGGQLHVTEGI